MALSRETARSGTDINPLLKHFSVFALIAFLAWIPLPFGSNRLWSSSLLVAFAGSILLIVTLSSMLKPTSLPLERNVFWSLIFFGSSVAWAFVQASTWTPEALHHPIWALAGDALSTTIPGRVSVNPAKTIAAATNLLAYGALFWIALHFAKDHAISKKLLRAISVIVAIYAYYGLVVYLSGNETILWYAKWEYRNALTSTFVNRNSFATFAGIGLICSFSLVLKDLMPIVRARARGKVKISQMLLVVQSKHLGTLTMIFGTLLALMLSGSRAGIFSTFAGLCVLLVLMAPRSLGRFGRFRLAAIGLTFLLVFALPASGLLLDRLGQASIFESDRFEVYRLTLKAIGDAPIIGTGLGTFAEIFASYRDADVFTKSAWTKAHNTYLETWLELGLPAALVLQGVIAFLVWHCFKGARAKSRAKYIPAAAASASVLVGLHSLIDFSLQIPAVAATYAILLGLGVGSSSLEGRSGDSSKSLGQSTT